MNKVSAEDISFLSQWDTPTICNGLEVLDSNRTSVGFTTQHMVCADVNLSPIVGFARTATVRARTPSILSGPEQDSVNQLYYRHMAEQPAPTIAVVEDLDYPPGFGAWWGEVHTTIHKALGVLGVVTNGSIRDLDCCASDFQMLAGSVGPSHGHNHAVDVACEVNIFSMAVQPGDIVHADRHGAVIVPVEAVRELPGAIDLITKEEEALLATARASDFTVNKLLEKMKSGDGTH